jgi:hypothetical protein
MQSKFEAIDDGQFLTFVVSFFPPPPSMTFLPSPPVASPEPSPSSSTKLSACEFRFLLLICSVGLVLRKWLSERLGIHLPGLWLNLSSDPSFANNWGLTLAPRASPGCDYIAPRRCRTTSYRKRSQNTSILASSSPVGSSPDSAGNSRLRTLAVGTVCRGRLHRCWHR